MYIGLFLLAAGIGGLIWLVGFRNRRRPQFMDNGLAVSLIIVGLMAMIVFGIPLTIRG